MVMMYSRCANAVLKSQDATMAYNTMHAAAHYMIWHVQGQHSPCLLHKMYVMHMHMHSPFISAFSLPPVAAYAKYSTACNKQVFKTVYCGANAHLLMLIAFVDMVAPVMPPAWNKGGEDALLVPCENAISSYTAVQDVLEDQDHNTNNPHQSLNPTL